MRAMLLLVVAVTPLLAGTAGAQIVLNPSAAAEAAEPEASSPARQARVRRPRKAAAKVVPPPAARPSAPRLPATVRTQLAPMAPGPAVLPDLAPSAAVAPVRAEPLASGAGEPAASRVVATDAPAPAAAPVLIETVAGAAEPTILLRAAAGVGLAAFRSGDDTIVVLDTAIDFQPPARNPAFGQISSRRTQDATVISIPLPAPGSIRMVRTGPGWLVTAGLPEQPMANIVPRLIANGPSSAAVVQLTASSPSRVVTILDQQSGGSLLIGTQMTPGDGVSVERRQVQYSLMPTFQGVVVAASSDEIRLQRNTKGFTLDAGTRPGSTIITSMEAQGSPAAETPPLSRLFDFGPGPIPALVETLKQRTQAAGNAPARARAEPRLQVVEAMLSLGMGIEALAVLDVAGANDPSLQELPRAIGLRAIAALMSQRPEDAEGLSDPRLTGTREIELWRALLQLARDKAGPEEARRLAGALPVLLAYPRPLRDRLLPRSLETMALNGEAAAAQEALLQMPDDTSLDLARAMAFEAAGQAETALKTYDLVAGRPDRLARYRAILRAVELRLKRGLMETKDGADALDHALYGWREPRDELSLRIRIAALRRQAGQWKEALAVLKDGRAASPESREPLEREMAQTLLALMTGDAPQKLPATEFVALFDQNLDTVQSMSWPEPAGLALVDHLTTLGLQSRAEPVMARLVAQSTSAARRPFLGARLASLRLEANDPAGAIAALSDTVPQAGPTIDPALLTVRQFLYARAESERGNKDQALAMLESVATTEADEARADIYAARQDWPHTISALSAVERARIGSASVLNADQQALVMRMAVAATLAPDGPTLARLTSTYTAAMAKSESAGLFRVITSTPVQGTKDLPRAFEEIQLARKLTSAQTARP